MPTGMKGTTPGMGGEAGGSDGLGPRPTPEWLLKQPVEMPVAQVFAASFVLPMLIAVVAWILFATARPQGVSAIVPGMIAGVAGTLLGPLMARVWVARPVTQWGMLLLGSQGASFFGVLGASLLLYWTTRPDPVTFVLVAGGSFFAVQVVHARLYASRLRRPPVPSGSVGGDVDQAP